MRAYDAEELKATLRVFEGDIAIESPMVRGRAFEIARHLIKREIEREENGEEIEKVLCVDETYLREIIENDDDVDLLKHKVKDMQRRVSRMGASFDSINDRLDRVCASFFPLYEALTRCFTQTEKEEEADDLLAD